MAMGLPDSREIYHQGLEPVTFPKRRLDSRISRTDRRVLMAPSPIHDGVEDRYIVIPCHFEDLIDVLVVVELLGADSMWFELGEPDDLGRTGLIAPPGHVRLATNECHELSHVALL
jgi:hypothetical protein